MNKDENQNWEGRKWITSSDRREGKDAVIRFLSYHIFPDYNKCDSISYSTTRAWSFRAPRLLNEILSYDPSIACLQDFDHLNDWWQPRLGNKGFDICAVPRTRFRETSLVEYVGVVFKASLFQLFKSVHVELNKCCDDARDLSSSFKDRCKTDDVGIIVFLQPWSTEADNKHIPTALCVATCMLSDRTADADVRKQQIDYFCKQIEIANSEFHLPVLLGTSLHDEPTSPAYHVLRTGRNPLVPKAPAQPPKPKIVLLCRGSVAVKWKPPVISVADPPILSYRISWCPGASKTLSFKAHIDVSAGDCVQYEDKPDHKGQIRSIAMEELSYVVSGLSSELPYEFRISAINRIGEGEASDITAPICLINPPKAPRMPELVTLGNIHQVRQNREQSRMEYEDWNALSVVQADAHNALTTLTPRTEEGFREYEVTRGRVVLPLHLNPREGWRGGRYLGKGSETLQAELMQEKCLRKSVIRTRTGFNAAVSDYPSGKMADIIDYNATLKEIQSKNKVWRDQLDAEMALEKEREIAKMNGSVFSDHSELGKSSSCGNSNGRWSPLAQGSSAEELGYSPNPSAVAAASVSFDDSNLKSFQTRSVLEESDVFSQSNSKMIQKLHKRNAELEQSENLSTGGSRSGSDSDSDSGSGDSWASGEEGEEEEEDQNTPLDELVEGTMQTGTEIEGSNSFSMGGSSLLDPSGSVLTTSIQGSTTMSSSVTGLPVANLGTSYIVSDSTIVYDRSEDYYNDDVVMDCRDVVHDVGVASQRQLHALNLRSAYEYYCSAGEPLFTKSEPIEASNITAAAAPATIQMIHGTTCADYIFYSASYLKLISLLSMPTLNQLQGHNPRENRVCSNPYWNEIPPGFAGSFSLHYTLSPLKKDIRWNSGGEVSAMTRKLAITQEALNVLKSKQYKKTLSRGMSSSTLSSQGDVSAITTTSSAHSTNNKPPTYSKEFIKELKRNLASLLNTGSTFSALKPQNNIGSKKTNQPISRSSMKPNNRNPNPTTTTINNNTYSNIYPTGPQTPLVWAGAWIPYSSENIYNRHYWLPNESYASSHISLCAEFVIREENMLSRWC